MYSSGVSKKRHTILYYNAKIIINVIEKENMPRHILFFIAINMNFILYPVIS